MDNLDYLEIAKFEDKAEWRKWMKDIPAIPVKAGWKIQPLPPFSGAVARMRVILPDGQSKSIYLDCYDRLGCFGSPYWEVYPVGDDVGRCEMHDIELLVSLIEADGEE